MEIDKSGSLDDSWEMNSLSASSCKNDCLIILKRYRGHGLFQLSSLVDTGFPFTKLSKHYVYAKVKGIHA